MKDHQWFELTDSGKIKSPSLLVYPDRVLDNTRLMIRMAGGPERLRPHIKTHKMADIISLQLKLGISRFKCATLSEAELLAKTGARDVLLAMQPVAIHLENYIDLIEKYPETAFSTIIDNQQSCDEMQKSAKARNIHLDVWMDINNGMNRTGISPGKEAETLFSSICQQSQLQARGLHVYDGHIHDADPEIREINCDQAFEGVENLKTTLEKDGYTVLKVVAGGTPTFPIHKKRKEVELSPGTPLLWDQGYANQFKDLDFQPAAVLMTRVISKPKKNLLCFDLGHKSVASEMQLPRVKFLGNHKFEQISQSEEHLVVKSDNADAYLIGDTCYALPIHICPTVVKYPKVLTVEHGAISGNWKVSARDH